jgi:hypothetical protein
MSVNKENITAHFKGVRVPAPSPQEEGYYWDNCPKQTIEIPLTDFYAKYTFVVLFWGMVT